MDPSRTQFFDLSDSAVVSSPSEGEVYRKRIDGTDYLIKTRGSSMQHEYDVGIKLNSLDTRYFCRTYDHFEKDGRFFLVTEFFEGRYVDPTNYENVLTELFLFLLSLREQGFRFTHYDLHRGNFLVRERNAPLLKEFSTPYGPVELLSEYEIKLIDFGYSYADGVEVDCVETDLRRLAMGKVPILYDPDYDLFSVLVMFGTFRQSDRGRRGSDMPLLNAYDSIRDRGFVITVHNHSVEPLVTVEQFERLSGSKVLCFGSAEKTDETIDDAIARGNENALMYLLVRKKEMGLQGRPDDPYVVRNMLRVLLGHPV